MGKYVCKWKLVIFVGGLGVLMIIGIMKINYKIVNYYIIWMNGEKRSWLFVFLVFC